MAQTLPRYTEQTQVRFTEEQRERLEGLAREDGRSLSDFIRRHMIKAFSLPEPGTISTGAAQEETE